MSQEQNKDMSQYFYRASAASFVRIPGNPIAYWVTERIASIFSSSKLFEDVGQTRRGLQPGNSERFVRSWSEVSYNKIGQNIGKDEAKKSGLKWFLFNSGGAFRKWYGNLNDVVNWERDGHEIKATGRAIIPSEEMYFLQAITWPKVSSGKCSFRWFPDGIIPGDAGPCFFDNSGFKDTVLCFSNSKVALTFLQFLSPTLNFEVGVMAKMPIVSPDKSATRNTFNSAVKIHSDDWNSIETSIGFSSIPILSLNFSSASLESSFQKLYYHWRSIIHEAIKLEEDNNRLFINAYSLQDELSPDVPIDEITLICNPHYRYGCNRSEQELETLQKCDTVRELVSYAIGCMMGRYSLDKPGLILASQGETLQDYLSQIPSPRFAPDDDGILPMTDQEWFADDATNRFREFVRTAWGEKTLQENLDFVAESLCLHAIKLKKSEDSLDTIRRYLSSQFYKDHLRTYKKRPIYWLFSSGKQKAFECLVYLHRYNEGSLARMRTEYVIPLTAKLNAHANKLEKDIDASSSTAEKKALEKQLTTLHNQQAELATFDEKLRHYADQRIRLDLDDGVRVNYGKFGDLLAEVNAITGGSDE